MGLTLTPARPSVANYLGTKRSGDLLFVAGKVSALRGEVGTEIDVGQARRAARDTMLELLSIIRQDLGDLDRILSVERMQGFVRSAATFTEQPQVIDGASDRWSNCLARPGATPARQPAPPSSPLAPPSSWTWCFGSNSPPTRWLPPPTTRIATPSRGLDST